MTAPTLKTTLQDDLTSAIRTRDAVRSATLRLALTAIKAAEVSGDTARALDDAEVLAVLAREAKKRREAAQAFADAGRAERAAAETAELAVLEAYLPRPLDDAALADLVATAVAEAATAGASGMKAMGQVVKAVRAAADGRADGGRIAAEVKRQLASA